MCNDKAKRLNQALEECLSGIDNHYSLEARVMARMNGQRHSPRKLTVMMACVLVMILLTFTALAAAVLLGLFQTDQSDVGTMRSCVATGDKLYLLSTDGLYTWLPGQDTPTLEMTHSELEKKGLSADSHLFAYGASIGLLHPNSRSVWCYKNSELLQMLTYEDEWDQNRIISSAVCADGYLFVRVVSTDTVTAHAEMYRLDLTTGTWENYKIGDVIEICSYTDGQILVLMHDEQRVYLYPMDIASGQFGEALCSTTVQGLCGVAYEPDMKRIYAQVNGVLSYWGGDEWIQLQGYAQHYLSNCYAVLKEGYVAISFDEMQFVPFVDNQTIPTLTIEGYIPTSNVDSDFQRLNPGMAVVRKANPTLTSTDVRNAIISGDTTDLFHVKLDAELIAMFNEGLLVPLTSSDVLFMDTSEMPIVIQEGLRADNQLFAVPSRGYVSVWESDSVRINSFEKLLKEAPHISHCWENSEWTKEDYADFLLTTYISETYLITGKIDFDSAEFASALTALNEWSPSPENCAGVTPVITTSVLIDLGGDLATNANNGTQIYSTDAGGSSMINKPMWVIPCVFYEELLESLPIELTVYVLNPNSKHPDMAIAYLEYFSTHRSPSDEAMLKPSHAEPSLRPSIQQHIDWIIEEQHAYDAQQGVETDEKALARRVDAIRNAPDSWDVEAIKLSAYRENIAPFMRLELCPILTMSVKHQGGLYDSMLEVVLSYCNGDIPLETCITELNALSPLRDP